MSYGIIYLLLAAYLHIGLGSLCRLSTVTSHADTMCIKLDVDSAYSQKLMGVVGVL